MVMRELSLSYRPPISSAASFLAPEDCQHVFKFRPVVEAALVDAVQVAELLSEC
jgi:hypothetical protein